MVKTMISADISLHMYVMTLFYTQLTYYAVQSSPGLQAKTF